MLSCTKKLIFSCSWLRLGWQRTKTYSRCLSKHEIESKYISQYWSFFSSFISSVTKNDLPWAVFWTFQITTKERKHNSGKTWQKSTILFNNTAVLHSSRWGIAQVEKNRWNFKQTNDLNWILGHGWFYFQCYLSLWHVFRHSQYRFPSRLLLEVNNLVCLSDCGLISSNCSHRNIFC